MDFFRDHIKLLRNSFGYTQEQLAKLLLLETGTVTYYETGKIQPSIQILVKISKVFGISMDFLIHQDNDCKYPKNIKLLRMAKILDTDTYYEARSNIEGVIKSILGRNTANDSTIKQDIIEIELQESFHKNLKEIRNSKKLTQPRLAESIGTTRDTIAQHEQKTFPPIERLVSLANYLDISIHALVTGEKLRFDFDDRFFGKTILYADQKLSLEDQKVIIRLLEAAIENKK